MGLAVLSRAQMHELQMLKQSGILQPVEEHLLSSHKQTFVCFCGDGKHSRDLTGFHATLCGHDEAYEEALFHQVALNGGALVLSPSNALANLHGLPQDLVGIMNIEYALKLKGNHGQIALYIHAPCGAAKEAGLESLLDVIDQGMRAKFRIRTIFARPLFAGTIGCYFHVCKRIDGEILRKTYFVSRTDWETWLLLPQNYPRLAEWNLYKERITVNPGWYPKELWGSIRKR